MYKRNAQGWSKYLDFILIDEISLRLALILAARIYLKVWVYSASAYRAYVVVLLLADAAVAVMLNSFHNVLNRSVGKEIIATIKHCLAVFAIMAVFMFGTQTGVAYSRVTLALTLLFHLLIGFSSRMLWKRVARRHGEKKRNRQSMLVVLQNATAEEMLERLKENTVEGYEVVGAVLREKTDRQEICGVPVVAEIEEAAAYICREWIDKVYVDCPATDPVIAEFMDDCSQMGVPVHYHVPAVSREGTKRFAEMIGGTTVLTTSINYATPVQLFVKRLFDILGGIVGSLFALLVMMIVGPIIKAKSPGPVLYKQTRIGKNGKPFKIYKIRSMYMDADERKKELMAQNRVKDGMMFKLDFDPRIIGNEILPDGTKKTGIGEFIRKTSLDEFPQFFNVLAGQMSLVGTRPPTADEWEKYELHHRARMSIKPGITGLWQVSGRSNITDFEEVVRLDTEYILNWSYALDLKIMFQPMISVIIPVYNVAPYLAQCVDSILAQTYPDFELILIDDGSADGSGAICDAYALKDERVVVIHKPNGGVSSARNAGLEQCKGEFISFIDSDDWIEPTMFQDLHAAIVETGTDFAVCNEAHVYDTEEGLHKIESNHWPNIQTRTVVDQDGIYQKIFAYI